MSTNLEQSQALFLEVGLILKTNCPFTNARDLLARDIRELRRVYPNIPNSKLKELIDLNKKMYPEMRKPAKDSHH